MLSRRVRVDMVEMVVWQGGVGGASREELAREGNKSGEQGRGQGGRPPHIEFVSENLCMKANCA